MMGRVSIAAALISLPIASFAQSGLTPDEVLDCAGNARLFSLGLNDEGRQAQTLMGVVTVMAIHHSTLMNCAWSQDQTMVTIRGNADGQMETFMEDADPDATPEEVFGAWQAEVLRCVEAMGQDVYRAIADDLSAGNTFCGWNQ